MAALNRPLHATYEVHESVRVDTSDNEDHTFCGIMFPIKAKRTLPVERIVIHSIAIRGHLGPMTIWVTNEQESHHHHRRRHRLRHHRSSTNNNSASTRPQKQDNNDEEDAGEDDDDDDEEEDNPVEYRFRLSPRYWTKVYDKVHPPSPRVYQKMILDTPIVIPAGKMRAIYIHSTLEGDEAIVYDNSQGLGMMQHPRFMGAGLLQQQQQRRAQLQQQQQQQHRYEDARMAILSGKAHLSHAPFGEVPIWGWGNAWRDHREFVGQLEYGVVYKLWQPERSLNCLFGNKFQQAALRMLACQRRDGSTSTSLPDECVFYILNMCRWDWFGDTPTDMKIQRRLTKRKRRIWRELQRQQQEQAAAEQRQRGRAEETAETETAGTGAWACTGAVAVAVATCDAAAAAAAANTKPSACNNRSAARCTGTSASDQHQLPHPHPQLLRQEHQEQSSNQDDLSYDAEEEEKNDSDYHDEFDDDDDDDDDDEEFEDAAGESEDTDDDDDDMMVDANNDNAAEAMVLAAADEETAASGAAAASAVVAAAARPNNNDNDDDDSDNNDDDGSDADSDESAWERANGYRADGAVFTCRYYSSDDDEDDHDFLNGGDGDRNASERQNWFSRNIARIHVLRALARGSND